FLYGPLLCRLVLSELSPEQFLYRSLDKLLHARLLFARLRTENRSAGFLSSVFESLAVFLHPGRRLHPRLLQLLLHAGIFSLLNDEWTSSFVLSERGVLGRRSFPRVVSRTVLRGALTCPARLTLACCRWLAGSFQNWRSYQHGGRGGRLRIPSAARFAPCGRSTPLPRGRRTGIKYWHRCAGGSSPR